MKCKIIYGLFLMIILVSSISLAVTDEDVKKVLRRSILEFLEDPSDTTLTLAETKDFLEFYLEIPPEEKDDVVLTAPVEIIFSEALIGHAERSRVTTQTRCSPGWKCKTDFHKAYRTSSCERQSVTFCNYGCLDGECKPIPAARPGPSAINVSPDVIIGNVTNQTCKKGWICEKPDYRRYINSDCKLGKGEYCPNGCKEGVCVEEGACQSHTDCADGQFCEFENCTAEIGSCVEVPTEFFRNYDPVCGCNGITYPNDLRRKEAKVSKDYDGVCEEDPCKYEYIVKCSGERTVAKCTKDSQTSNLTWKYSECEDEEVCVSGGCYKLEKPCEEIKTCHNIRTLKRCKKEDPAYAWNFTKCPNDMLCAGEECKPPQTYQQKEEYFIKNYFKPSKNINCRLICGGLCYNQENIICIDGIAQKKGFTKEGIHFSESNPIKSYELNKETVKVITMDNNYGKTLNTEVIARFNIVGGVDTASFEKEIFRENITINDKETKTIEIKIPTDEETINGNIFVWVKDNENPNWGIGSPYSSYTFTIYDPTKETENCNGFIFNPVKIEDIYVTNKENHLLCTDNLYIPLGKIGCNNDEDCEISFQKCCEHHCFPHFVIDKSPEEINLLVATVYLEENKSIIEWNEEGIQIELNNLTQKLEEIKSITGNPKNINVKKEKCQATKEEIKNFLEKIDPKESSHKNIEDLLELCKINREGYSYIYVAFPLKGLTSDEMSLTTIKFMGGIIAGALYVGDGYIIGQIDWGTLYQPELFPGGNPTPKLWPVILHEITHSFGAPDLYSSDYIHGQSYLFGDCRLMMARPTTMDTPLCPLELTYYKTE